jgi:hypothetical protein
VRKFAQVFHVGAIIELIENDDLMNEQEEEEEEEEVKFNKLSVVFHPKKEREKERKREKETHIIIAVKNLIDPVCLKTNDAKETTEERCRPQKKIINTAQTTTTSTTTTTKKKKKIASLLTLQCGYFFAKRMATWEAIKPAPPVINTFFGSYGISHSLFFMTMFLPSLKRIRI